MGTERMTDSAARATDFSVVGSIASTAPQAALLRALQRLRPQCTVRLRRGDRRAATPVYVVEIRNDASAMEGSAIDAWLRIKSALVAEFPAGTHHAVTPLES